MKYEVTLIGVGKDRSKVIKALREAYPDLTTAEAEHLVDSAPTRIDDALDLERQQWLKAKLEGAGAKIEVHKYFPPFSIDGEYFQSWASKHDVLEAYRFTYLPSLHAPVTVWLWVERDRDLQCMAQLGEPPAEPHARDKERVSKENKWAPAEQVWRKLLQLIEHYAFWSSGSRDSEHSGLEKDTTGTGGAVWCFEGYKDKQYKVLECSSPDEGMAHEVGHFFFSLLPEGFGAIEIY